MHEEPVVNTLPILMGRCACSRWPTVITAHLSPPRLCRSTTAAPLPRTLYEDGHNYVAFAEWVLFGHHFAAIAGAGPLVGPTLAAQFGFAPGFLWIVIGAVSSLAACRISRCWSRRFAIKGRSLADIARTEIGPFAGLVDDDRRALHFAGHACRTRHCRGQRAVE